MTSINPKHSPLVLSHSQPSLFPKITVLRLPNLLLPHGQGDSWTDFQFKAIPQWLLPAPGIQELPQTLTLTNHRSSKNWRNLVSFAIKSAQGITRAGVAGDKQEKGEFKGDKHGKGDFKASYNTHVEAYPMQSSQTLCQGGKGSPGTQSSLTLPEIPVNIYFIQGTSPLCMEWKGTHRTKSDLGGTTWISLSPQPKQFLLKVITRDSEGTSLFPPLLSLALIEQT